MTSAYERHPVAETAQPLPRPRERFRIAVDADQPHVRMALEKRFRVSAESHRRVDERAVSAIRDQVLEDFAEKNRLVNHWFRGHAVTVNRGNLHAMELQLLEVFIRERCGLEPLLHPLFIPDDQMVLTAEHDDVFRARGAMHYGTSWSAIYYFIKSGRKAMLDRYFEALMEGKNQQQAFDVVFGPGKANVLNTLIPRAQGEIVLLSDANTIIEPSALKTMVRHFDDETVGAALDYIDKHAKDDKPFFVWMNTTRMHIYTHIRPEYKGKNRVYPSESSVEMRVVLGLFALAALALFFGVFGGLALAVSLPATAALQGTIGLSWVEHAQAHGHLQAVGVDAAARGNHLFVAGTDRGRPPRGRVDTARDHRLAMAFAVLGTLPGADVRLSEKRSVAISYPTFFHDLRRIGARLTAHGAR